MKRSILKALAFAAIVLILLLIVSFLLIQVAFSGELDYPAVEILAVPSPDGRYELTVEQLGEPSGLFGPVTARITLRNVQTGKQIDSFKEEVMNDGGGLHESQFTVTWEETRVHILIDPAESENIRHTLELT